MGVEKNGGQAGRSSEARERPGFLPPLLVSTLEPAGRQKLLPASQQSIWNQFFSKACSFNLLL